jgi:hypothetical protein
MDVARTIAACGLDCTECDIRLAADDPEIAQATERWFDRELGMELKFEDFLCQKLTEWAAGSERYSNALERLKRMK